MSENKQNKAVKQSVPNRITINESAKRYYASIAEHKAIEKIFRRIEGYVQEPHNSGGYRNESLDAAFHLIRLQMIAHENELYQRFFMFSALSKMNDDPDIQKMVASSLEEKFEGNVDHLLDFSGGWQRDTPNEDRMKLRAELNEFLEESLDEE